MHNILLWKIISILIVIRFLHLYCFRYLVLFWKKGYSGYKSCILPPLMEQSLISKIPTTCTSFGLYVRIYYLQLSVYAYGVAELMYARAWALKVWLLVSFPRSDRRIKSQGPLVMAKPGTFSKDIYCSYNNNRVTAIV